jgi:ArsR family transcriptional regulator, virulence genes transcriptional regulator
MRRNPARTAFTRAGRILHHLLWQHRLQADLCQTLSDPTRLELLYLLGDSRKAVKEVIEATGQRQAKISQHLALLRQRGIVRAERVGTEVHYSLADPLILEACRITREILLQQLAQQGALATTFSTTGEQ